MRISQGNNMKRRKLSVCPIYPRLRVVDERHPVMVDAAESFGTDG